MKTQKIKKEKKSKRNGGKAFLFVGVFALFITFIVYLALLTVEKTVMDEYDKATVYIADRDYVKGEQLTKDGLNNFTKREINVEYLTEDSVTDITELENSYVVTKVFKNEVLTKSDFAKTSKTDNRKDLQEIGIESSNVIFGGVNGEIRASDFVDIYFVPKSYSLQGSTKGVILEGEEKKEEFLKPDYEKVFVNSVYDADGNEITNADEVSCASRYNFTFEQEEVRKIISKLASGYKVYIVKNE